MTAEDTTADACAEGTCAHRTRRTFLRGAAVTGGVALAGGALAACGGSGEATGSKTTDSEGDSGGGGSKNLGPASSVQVGGGKIFAKQKAVVTQPTEGSFLAFTAVCTHQGCVVSEIVENAIVCPCHGSEFSIEDGSVLKGPAGSALAKKKITETGGELTLG